jgi:MFS family permease
MGISMQVAISQWQVYQLTNSPLQLGLVGLMNVLPVILFGIFGGAVADVADRRKLVAVSQVVRMLVVAALSLLTTAEVVQVWQIYAGGLIGSLASAFDQPSRQAMIFSLVPRQHLLNAVTWHNVQRDASNLMGPAIAGIVMGGLSIAAAYLLNAIFFVPLIFAVIRLPVGDVAPARGGTLTVLRDGLTFLRQSPVIMTSLTLDFCLTFFGPYRALLALYARDILDVGPQGFGFLTSAVAVGGMLGSAFVLSLGDAKYKGRLQLGAMLVYAVAVAAFAFSTFFPLSLALAAGCGLCDTIGGTMRRSLIQLRAPEEYQGRVGALQVIVGQGGPALGAVQAGTLAGLIGAPPALALGAALVGIIALGASFRSRSFRLA